ncbi:MAG: hypothetical protein AAF291_12230 [Pseudomonadota bacterium]
MTSQNPSLWKTPGPWLGFTMGVGAPALYFTYAFAGPIAAVALFVTLILISFGITRRLSGEHVVRAYGSKALVRYNKRFLIASLGYVAGMLIAAAIYNRGMPPGPLGYAVSLLPTLPVLAMIVIMARYLMEETDEYLRHRASLSSLIGLGVVLVLGTVWGFLETFGLAPHIWAWWVMPAWAIGLGIGQGVLSLSEKSDDDDETA